VVVRSSNPTARGEREPDGVNLGGEPRVGAVEPIERGGLALHGR
jgi:hypothetical protein